MKKVLLGLTVAVILAVTAVPQAQANAFLQISITGGPSVSCDNTTAASTAACIAAGFTTVQGASGNGAITYTNPNLGGVVFDLVRLSSNNPGTPTNANTQDVKFNLNNVSGASRTVTVNFAINNFTQPIGPAFLSASQTGNWTTSVATDNQNFTAWERNTNDLVVPGGTAVAFSPTCTSPGGSTVSCSTSGADAPVGVTNPFALTGQQVITMAAGTQGTFSGTTILNSTPQVPEPSSVVLLGTGMLLLAGRQWRKRKN